MGQISDDPIEAPNREPSHILHDDESGS